MSFIAMLPPSIVKEVRALVAPWLVCVACMLVIAVTNEPRLFGPLAIIAYLVGTVGLGALSIGHEYTGRTLSLLLTLPARRERLLVTKLGVLGAMLLSLWGVAEAFVFSGMPGRHMPGSRDAYQMMSLIPLICGLFLAPWLTMACRSAVGGSVFALTIPGILMVIGELLGMAKYGHGAAMQAFHMTFVWFGTLGLCAVGAVMNWRMFTRLEAIEGPHQDVRWPLWLRAISARGTAAPQLTRHHPAWLLVKKEIVLQQLPLVLAVFYVLCWISAEWLTTFVADLEYHTLFAALSLPFALLLSMLIGSTASAAERQIGTLEWQVLLPVAAWKQWAVKVGVVFGLAMLLALGVPMMLLYFSGLARTASPVANMAAQSAITIIILITAGSLYVSSLSRNRMLALVMSIPVALAAMLFLQFVLERVAFVSYAAAMRLFPRAPSLFDRSVDMFPPGMPTLLLIAGFLGITLRFAFINHRSADRPAKRVWTQVILIATFVAVGIITGAAWQAIRR